MLQLDAPTIHGRLQPAHHRSRPANDVPPFPLLLIDIQRLGRIVREHWLVPTGVPAGQDVILLTLAANGSLTICELADRVTVRPSTISKMATRMCDSGWLKRGRHLDVDKRRILLRLTQDGERKADAVRAAFEKGESELKRYFGPSRFDELTDALALTCNSLTERVAKIR